MLQQIYWWFWNRLVPGGKKKRKQEKSLLSLTAKKSRPPQPYQAYLTLYTTKVMPRLHQLYEEHKASVAEGEEAKKWWPFVITEAKRLLSQETDEVKQEVADYREMVAKGEESIEDFLKKIEAGEAVSAHEQAVVMQQ